MSAFSSVWPTPINNVALSEVKEACVSWGGVKGGGRGKETVGDKEKEEMGVNVFVCVCLLCESGTGMKKAGFS